MGRRSKGPDATSIKQMKKGKTPSHVESNSEDENEHGITNSNGRRVSSKGITSLNTVGLDVSKDIMKPAVLTEQPSVPSAEVQSDSGVSFDDMESDADSGPSISESDAGSEAAEIDVNDLDGIEDVDALEQFDLTDFKTSTEDKTKLRQQNAKGIDKEEDEDADEDDGEEDDEEEIALSDIGSEQDAADITPRVRETINNITALNAAYNRINLELPSQFSQHQTLTAKESSIDVDVNDDLARELAFYKQALQHAQEAKSLIAREGAPWERPSDYFAEMVKTDDHMERIRKELVTEATSKKASAEAKRQRELKKFGKQVQINKTLERAKQKRDTIEKVSSLKRKRGNDIEGKEDFNVALDEAIADKPRARGAPNTRGTSRSAKDSKFGFGGKKRYAKSNTTESTLDFSGGRGGSARGGRGRGRGRGSSRGGGTSRGSRSRPGKSKRG